MNLKGLGDLNVYDLLIINNSSSPSNCNNLLYVRHMNYIVLCFIYEARTLWCSKYLMEMHTAEMMHFKLYRSL